MRMIDADKLLTRLMDAELDQMQLKTGEELCQIVESMATVEQTEDVISRQAVLDMMQMRLSGKELYKAVYELPSVKPQEPKADKYEHHIDHTDCIWYGSDGGCPVTCSQYRDGWNDAMDYIFKNGKGYQPYRHDG